MKLTEVKKERWFWEITNIIEKDNKNNTQLYCYIKRQNINKYKEILTDNMKWQ